MFQGNEGNKGHFFQRQVNETKTNTITDNGKGGNKMISSQSVTTKNIR